MFSSSTQDTPWLQPHLWPSKTGLVYSGGTLVFPNYFLHLECPSQFPTFLLFPEFYSYLSAQFKSNCFTKKLLISLLYILIHSKNTYQVPGMNPVAEYEKTKTNKKPHKYGSCFCIFPLSLSHICTN